MQERQRIFNMRKPELVEKNPESNVWKTLNQDNVLDQLKFWYPVKPPVATALCLIVREDPVILDVDMAEFQAIVEPEIAVIVSRQNCLRLNGRFNLHPLLEGLGSEVPAIHLAHIIGHVVLPAAFHCREPYISWEELHLSEDELQEKTYQNRLNLTEFKTVFPFPTRVAHVGALADTVLDYMDLWVRGRHTTDLEETLKRKVEMFNEDRRRTQT